MNQIRETSPKLFPALLIGFGAQVAGRLVDLQWHLTHEEFEGAGEQVQAHWLIWLATVFLLGSPSPVSGMRMNRASGAATSSFSSPISPTAWSR
jgi:hypothetical protein